MVRLGRNFLQLSENSKFPITIQAILTAGNFGYSRIPSVWIIAAGREVVGTLGRFEEVDDPADGAP